MQVISTDSPADDLAAFLTSFTEGLAFGDDDLAAVVARHYPEGFEQYSDGRRFDRDELAAHAAPLRKNLVSWRVDVQEALVSGRRLAARYTMHSTMRKGRELEIEVYMFGELDGEGRFRRIDQLTRTVAEQNTPAGA